MVNNQWSAVVGRVAVRGGQRQSELIRTGGIGAQVDRRLFKVIGFTYYYIGNELQEDRAMYDRARVGESADQNLDPIKNGYHKKWLPLASHAKCCPVLNVPCLSSMLYPMLNRSNFSLSFSDSELPGFLRPRDNLLVTFEVPEVAPGQGREQEGSYSGLLDANISILDKLKRKEDVCRSGAAFCNLIILSDGGELL